jgi:chemotaxis protein methyltransferase CheR
MTVPITDDALDELLDVIYARYHHDFRQYARASLRRRVANALSQLQVAGVPELTRRIADDAALFARLLAWFTIQLSELFRDPAYFRYFREHIVPILGTYPSRKLWIAGCSTGEEAYSFAIILAEEGLLERTLIYATDIYDSSLRTARAGIYPLDRMRGFSESYHEAGGKASLSGYYQTGETGALFDRALRDHIVFADHSLATDTVFAEVQVVSCRNVLIYFSPELQDRAFGLFEQSLVHHGWLGLGARETVEFSSHRADFTQRPEHWYQRVR